MGEQEADEVLRLGEGRHALLDQWDDLPDDRAVPFRGKERIEPLQELAVGEPPDPDTVEVVQPVPVPLAAGALDGPDPPPLDELAEREDLLLGAGGPADEREVVDHRLRQIALLAELLDL